MRRVGFARHTEGGQAVPHYGDQDRAPLWGESTSPERQRRGRCTTVLLLAERPRSLALGARPRSLAQRRYTLIMDNLLLFWDLAWFVGAIGIVVLFWAVWSGRARGRKRCPKCRYDMSHAAEGADGLRCPECGYRVKRERQLLALRPRWRRFTLGALLVLAAIVWITLPRFQRDGWVAYVPDTVLILSMSPDAESWAARALHGRLTRPADKFNDRRMWDWQWRLMTRLASDGVRLGDASCFEGHHLALILGAPPPHDEKALPYLEDALKRGLKVNQWQLVMSMRMLALTGDRGHLRARYIETILSQAPTKPGQVPTRDVVRWLGQPWPEAEAAVPLLLDCLRIDDLDGASLIIWAAIGALERIQPREHEVIGPLLELLDRCDPVMHMQKPGSGIRLAILGAIAKLDPDNQRLRAELLADGTFEWTDAQLESLPTTRDPAAEGRFGQQQRAIHSWLDLGLDIDAIATLIRRFILADPYFFRMFARHFDRFVELGDEGARLLMHVIERSDSDSRIAVRAFDALEAFESIPDDVVQRLQAEAASSEAARAEAAQMALRTLGLDPEP